MVVSGQLGREIVPSIHNLRQVISIYVYCFDKKRNEQWACKHAKVRAVVVELDELVSRIKADHKIQKMVEEPLSINIFTTGGGAGNSTMGLNGEFVFSQVLIDCLIRLRYTESDKKELIRLCKQQYKGNSVELSNIREFQDEYSSDNVLWWYSRESFFYKTLNAALRTPTDIHTIFLFRKYITDIQYQLENYQAKNTLRVYRSQMISTNELETLNQCRGQFISVNSFFSTSIDKQQALSFLKVPDDAENLEAVLFQIDADPKMAITKPFADITEHSEYKDEIEVLFMLGSIFRVDSINRSKNGQVWIIQMTLCNDDEHDLKQVLMDMKEQFVSEETNLQNLGKILLEMGKPDLAQQYFIRMLEQLSLNDPLRIDLYLDLGTLESYAGHLDKSMEWRQKASALKKQIQSISSSSISKPKNPIVHGNDPLFKLRCELILLCGSIYRTFASYKSQIYRHHRELISKSLDKVDLFSPTNYDSNNGYTFSYADNYAFEHEATNSNSNDNFESMNEYDEETELDYPLFTETMLEHDEEPFDMKKFQKYYTRFLLELREQHLLSQNIVSSLTSSFSLLFNIVLYSNEVSVTNPIGPKKDEQKLLLFYYMLDDLLPIIRSLLNSIGLIGICLSKFLTNPSHRHIYFESMTNDLNELQTKGFTLSTCTGRLYFAFDLMATDNLAANDLGGFQKNFNNGHFCRMCYVSSLYH
ncbi:unnamed protein product [Rotaria sp. Silwood2]|nr:unnamed protein product [Rotaria sp. Silwood2]